MPRFEQPARLPNPEPHPKVVPDWDHANRPLSLLLAGQSIQRETVATTLQTPLKPRTTEPSTRRTNASGGSPELDSAV